MAEGRAELQADPTSIAAGLKVIPNEYMYSMHILGENTLENAKRLGYLDARELYPDIPKYTLEDYAKEFYGLEEPGYAFVI